jgi:flavin-dependent dehydrogenase
LAANGYSVLIVEKFKMPRIKSCSGILINKSIELIKSYFGECIPKTVMCTPMEKRGMIFTNDEGKEYVFEQKGLNIWRNSFDHWLAQKAISAGAKLKDETSVTHCEEQDGYVIVKLKNKHKGEHFEKVKIVIDCSGVVCSIKRKLMSFSRNYIYTYQTYNIGTIDLDYHYFYAYLQSQFSEYDAWFNVKDNYLIFGISSKDTQKIEQYYSKFMEYMTIKYNAKISLQEKTEKWIMPNIMPGCKIDYGIGRILFAGETAGFLNPMGEGISAGLESGYAAAKAIQQVDLNSKFSTQLIYDEYMVNAKTLKTYMERQWRFTANLSTKFRHMK